jgi:iron complex outermembrane receptor protein
MGNKMKKKIFAFLTLLPLVAFNSFLFSADEEEVDAVVVTGSYIKTDREEIDIPVDVFDRGEYGAAGAPNMREVLRNMPAISGTINQSEQFSDGGGTIVGLKNVNIRSLGIPRTLVLFNGKRIVNSAGTTKEGNAFVDVGNFPMIAMERIEVLKNGGAVSHGTDAMGGVFNFITRNKFEGFEATASHQEIDGSDGVQEAAFIAGFGNGGANLVFGAEWQNHNPLSVPEKPYVNMAGGWPLGPSSFGNPGTFQTTPAANVVADPACGVVLPAQGVAGGAASIAANINGYSKCGYNYVPFGNYIDPQERHKFFATMTMEISDDVELYAEALHTQLRADYYGSPSYPPTNAGYFTVVPTASPGYQDWKTNTLPTLSADLQAAYNAREASAGSVYWWGRAKAIEGPSAIFQNQNDTSRWSVGARGNLPGTDYGFDTSVTYSTMNNKYSYYDIMSKRWVNAVNGLGGTQCTRDAADAGDASKGCYYYNVFGSHLSAAPGSALANSADEIDYITGDMGANTSRSLLVFDMIVNGDLDFEIDGNAVAFAAGMQYRQDDVSNKNYGDARCADNKPCEPELHFLPMTYDSENEGKNFAFFGEVSLPVSENLDVDFGVRYEDYEADDIVVPKASAFYKASETLALRASYEEVFRSPVLPSSIDTSLERVYGEYYEVQTPIPTNLEPESSDNINIGLIWTPVEGMKVNLDYYSLDMVDPIGKVSTTSPLAIYNCADGTSYSPPLAKPDSCNLVNITTNSINGEGY